MVETLEYPAVYVPKNCDPAANGAIAIVKLSGDYLHRIDLNAAVLIERLSRELGLVQSGSSILAVYNGINVLKLLPKVKLAIAQLEASKEDPSKKPDLEHLLDDY